MIPAVTSGISTDSGYAQQKAGSPRAPGFFQLIRYCTVSVAELLVMLPEDAVIVAEEPETAVESTVAVPAELIVAIVLSLEAHVTDDVTVLVVPSEYVAVAT
jgi:hypothetical protein